MKVSIPYGKGKENKGEADDDNTPEKYQSPMGKVKKGNVSPEKIREYLYQSPMGKVKIS